MKKLMKVIPILLFAPLTLGMIGCDNKSIVEMLGGITLQGNVENGTIEVLGVEDLNKLVQDQEVTLKITPNEGYKLKSVTVNGNDILKTLSFKIDNPNAAYVVEILFEKVDETKPNPEKPEGFKYGVKFNIANPGDNGDFRLTGKEALENATETSKLLSSIDIENCFKDNGFKFSSKKTAGKATFNFNKTVDIDSVNVKLSLYREEQAPLILKVGNVTKKLTNISNGDNIFTFDTQSTSSLTIETETAKRFVLDGFELNGSTENGGGEEIKPDPETQEPATVSVNVIGNGQAVADKTEGLSGEKCTISVTHDETHYCSKVIANGERASKNGKTYTFTLKPGVNLVDVEFKEFTPGVGHPEYFEPEAFDYGTRGNQGTVDEYYESCRGLTGAALKAELNRICQPTKRYDYDHLRTSFKDTDENPDNPGYMTLFYTGEQYKISSFSGWSYINREHVWPNSRGTGKSGPGSDKHMQRPCEQKINSTRSSYDFGYASNGKDLGASNPINKGCYVGGGKFEPKDEFKGDAARIIFYMAMCYDKLELARPSDTSRFNYFSGSNYHGDFEDLYEWATDVSIDPVSKLEMNRNNVIDIKYQHNRNPFIDHPEFIEMIYDKTYSGAGALND